MRKNYRRCWPFRSWGTHSRLAAETIAEPCHALDAYQASTVMSAAPAKAAQLSDVEIAVSCVELPPQFDSHPIFLAVQRGKDVVDITPASVKQAEFRLSFRLDDRAGRPNFLGPYAQGPADERFFYLTWGTGASPASFGMFRRLKVHLSKLTWAEIKAATKRQAPLRVQIKMTDRRGGPLCASAWPDDPAVTWG